MKKFLSQMKLIAVTELKRYFRWKTRIFWSMFGALIGFLSFVVVWAAILQGGFQGLGMLTKDNYIAFVLSGSLLWTVIRTSIGRMSRHFVREKHRKTLAYIMISPLNRIAYLYGSLSQPILQMILRNTPVIIVALLLGFQFHGNILLASLIFILAFLAFSGVGLVLAALAAWKEGFIDAAWVVSEVLYLVSGVHYPLEVFPESLENIFRLLPTTQAIDALRAVGIQGAGVTEIAGPLIYLGVLSIISVFIGLYVFRRMAKKAMYLGI